MPPEAKYWFPAKRYGWGWGLPARWQGWVVMAAYFVLLVAGVLLFPPHAKPVGFVVSILVLTAVLTGVCWLTGEPPRWRWGDDRP
jgi:hypothetical protein